MTWIKINEERSNLPERYTEVIVTIKDGVSTIVAWRCASDNWYSSTNHRIDEDVIAWAYLPEPFIESITDQTPVLDRLCEIINADGSVQGETFSGDKYKGEYPSPRDGKETYEQYHNRVKECSKQGFHKGDLSCSDWQTYLYGSLAGGGQYVQNCIIGEVKDYEWVKYEITDED